MQSESPSILFQKIPQPRWLRDFCFYSFLILLSNKNEGASAGGELYLAADGGAVECGELVVLAESEGFAVEVHHLGAQIAVAAKSIEGCVPRKLYGGGIGEGVVDDEVCVVLTGVSKSASVKVSLTGTNTP